MSLTLVKSEHLDDWYVIERDGRPLADRDVEGDAEEMRAVCRAILARDSFRAKRCAVDVRKQAAWFSSPRSGRREARVDLTEADAFARAALAQLGPDVR
jgi:hypothetical protein